MYNVDDFFNNRWVWESVDVVKLVFFIGKNFFENMFYDFVVVGFGKIWDNKYGFGCCEGVNIFVDLEDEVFVEGIIDFGVVFDGYKGVDSLVGEFVGNFNDGCFGNGGVFNEGGFDFSCVEMVIVDVDNVINMVMDLVEVFVIVIGIIVCELYYLLVWKFCNSRGSGYLCSSFCICLGKCLCSVCGCFRWCELCLVRVVWR